jgi:diguanylate cyclase (GGDEF) domain
VLIKRRISIKTHFYSLFILAILFISVITVVVSYRISIKQVNDYYDITAKENAQNASTFIDGDFLRRLRDKVSSDEFQAIRLEAEETENDQLIIDYLKEQGLWEEFYETQQFLTKYLNNIPTLKYLYIVSYDTSLEHDMYLLDTEGEPLSEIGYLEEREDELKGVDITHLEHSVLSFGNWGWLYSNYSPVYTSDGEIVALVGCDIEMTDIISERKSLLAMIIAWTFAVTVIFILIILFFINRSMVRPLEMIANKVKEFNPRADMPDNDESIMNINLKANNEISDIAESVRDLELDIVHFLYDLNIKDRQIRQLNKLSMRDSLTGVGNVHGYKAAMGRIGADFANTHFAMVMADINNLKVINDTYGHKEGDAYIQQCCKILCDTFKHSAVYRIGGDEFIVLVQNEDYDNCNVLYAKLKLIFDNNFYNQEVPLNKRYSMSLGIGEKKDGDITIDRMFRDADRMMYDNKNKIKEAFEVQKNGSNN